ncbi:hypothetical protein GCM10022225_79530 [Plantactinospora mayteni]|uniref:Uncharacterized protein n=1 Tax=Plantactinospora mayteni TaxID=566021 RepID=A0ABQ4F3C0_9ACTN|nr:hypothetical protein Pma05_79810 [Plantactinospora mayteni]
MAQGHGAPQAGRATIGRRGTWGRVGCEEPVNVALPFSAADLEEGPSVADVPDGPSTVSPVLSGRIRAVPLCTVW